MIRNFYLGTHRPHWLELGVAPFFVSHRRLRGRRSLPRAAGPWALDSGGFTEVPTYGDCEAAASDYVAAVRRYRDEVGQLDWAAPQDWMCTPAMLGKTGLGVETHQRRTVENYLRLRDLAPEVTFVPVLQGWELSDYHRCVEMYDAAGVDLRAATLVGLGSVCSRQATGEIGEIVRSLAGLGLRLHGFGVKATGLGRYAEHLSSADSMAWSLEARRGKPLPGCSHRKCSSCLRYAVIWRRRVQVRLDLVQLDLPL